MQSHVAYVAVVGDTRLLSIFALHMGKPPAKSYCESQQRLTRCRCQSRAGNACCTGCPQLCWLAQVEKGATAAVFGLGTVGLACVDALRDVGASR